MLCVLKETSNPLAHMLILSLSMIIVLVKKLFFFFLLRNLHHSSFEVTIPLEELLVQKLEIIFFGRIAGAGSSHFLL